jgi:hypothetical protein
MRGTQAMRRVTVAAGVALVVTALTAAPAQAAPTSAYGGQAEQALLTGSTGSGLTPGAPAAPGGRSGDSGLPFSAFDLLLIIGGSGLILISGAGFGRLLADRQRIGHP